MAHTHITTRIMQSRIRGLSEEVLALRAENATLRAVRAALESHISAAKGSTAPEIPENYPTEPDYDLGGMEWIDPATGADTWHS